MKTNEDVALEHEGGNDYTLLPGQPSVWIAVDNVVVHIVRLNGINGTGGYVAAYRKGHENDDALVDMDLPE